MTDFPRCPLCQCSNHCAASTTDTPAQCWCFGQAVDAQALAALNLDPAEGCLCPACLARISQEREPPCA